MSTEPEPRSAAQHLEVEILSAWVRGIGKPDGMRTEAWRNHPDNAEKIVTLTILNWRNEAVADIRLSLGQAVKLAATLHELAPEAVCRDCGDVAETDDGQCASCAAEDAIAREMVGRMRHETTD